jgi:hypothetical protein
LLEEREHFTVPHGLACEESGDVIGLRPASHGNKRRCDIARKMILDRLAWTARKNG